MPKHKEESSHYCAYAWHLPPWRGACHLACLRHMKHPVIVIMDIPPTQTHTHTQHQQQGAWLCEMYIEWAYTHPPFLSRITLRSWLHDVQTYMMFNPWIRYIMHAYIHQEAKWTWDPCIWASVHGLDVHALCIFTHMLHVLGAEEDTLTPMRRLPK